MQHGANFNVFTSMLKGDAEKYTKRIVTTYKDFKQYYEQEKSGVVGNHFEKFRIFYHVWTKACAFCRFLSTECLQEPPPNCFLRDMPYFDRICAM